MTRPNLESGTPDRECNLVASSSGPFDGVAAGPYRLWGENDQFTSLKKKLRGLRVRVEENPASGDSDIPISLHEGCGYDVVVSSAASEQPLKGARISFGWTDIVREYTSDKQGIARIRNLGTDKWYFIVRADGYATEFINTSEQQLGSVLPLKFELAPGGKIVGTLRDDKGNPVADARVSISPGDLTMAPVYGQVQTDTDGRFSFDGLPIGAPLRLMGSKEGYDFGVTECGVGSADTPTRADFVCKKQPYGGDALVTVVAADGSPIAGATLFNRGNSTRDKRTATTGPLGRATLKNLFTQHTGCSITVKAKGFIPQRLPIVPGTAENPAELKVQLQLGRTVKGVVVNPDGTPAAKLRVYYNGGERIDPLGGRVTTDFQGRFELNGLPDDSTVTVYTPREFAPIKRLAVPMDEVNEFRIQLSIGGLIRARAVDSQTKAPISEFNVKLGFCENRHPNDPPTGSISSSMLNPGVNIQGSQKEYRLEGRFVGAMYKLTVSAEGYETKTIDRVEAHAGNLAKLVDVALDPVRSEDYQTVAGLLVDADGKWIAGAQFRLLLGSEEPFRLDPFTMKPREDGWRVYNWSSLVRGSIERRTKCVQLLKSVSDANGRFEFSNVKKGPPWMELFYFREGLMSQRHSNLRTQTPEKLKQLRFKAERPSSLRVIVDYSKYPSAHEVTLEAENSYQRPNAVKLAFGRETKTLTADQTEVKFSNLPSGTYVVQFGEKPVSVGGGGFSVQGIASKPVVIAEGDQVQIGL